MTALTRPFRETVEERVLRDPQFAKALAELRELEARVKAVERALRDVLACPEIDCHALRLPGCKYCRAVEAARKLLEGD